MIKIKAVQRKQLVGKYEGQYRFQMSPETYSALSANKVIKEAALPGLGTMRFGMNAKTCATLEEVKSSLITTRKVVFTPNTELKQELKNTSIKITCYDKDGNILSTVTSTDDGEVEGDNENENGGGSGNENQNQNENQGGNTGVGDVNGGGDNGGTEN